ncbi:MAG: M48 family metalloprotease [Chroococcus sp. CMT-3BRIN-NPC107]|jgi:Zn-dependent protease with chaperone function|nr:M48 family metalloprotease [Chroococcus sp. CMT-3BRIN-NPC107]
MAAVPKSDLEAGLTALKQGNFSRAVSLLEAVCQSSSQPPATKLQAQKALVAAYIGNKEDNRAVLLLHALSQNSDPQVKYWAALNHPQQNTPPIDATGFVVFEEDVPVANRDNEISPPKAEVIPPLVPQAAKEEFFTPATTLGWRQAPRAKQWQALREVSFIPLWLLMAGSAIALYWLLWKVSVTSMLFINDLLVKLPYLEPFQPFYRDSADLLRFLLLLLLACSPWLLDWLLQLSYDLQPLSIDRLAKYSPESRQVLQRFCRQQGWSLPQLAILPTTVPVAFTYGNLRRTARIVVSQGLLEQLAEDEIASIYASQLGHIASWNFAAMSLFMVVTQGVYAIYRFVAVWGDRAPNSTVKIAAIAISSAAYGLWWLLCLPALWLSQLRIYYGDWFAASITGNPNGLTRALIKIAIGMTTDVRQKECTSWLLESLNLFMPVGFYQALTLGSCYPKIEPILAWDCLNPYRYLFTINNTHPLIGDRLQRLNALAQYWHLDTELKLPPRSNPNLSNLLPQLKSLLTNRALLQFAAVFGLVLGLVFGGFSWLIGAITQVIWIPQLAWMYGDWLLIKAFIPIALSISLFLRINFVFPDITPASVSTAPSLAEQLAKITALPIDSQPVRLKGKLLGRRGIANWLGQDLLLNSAQGLIKLHYESPLGPIGNIFFRQSPSPMDLLGRYILVTGWFRRSATIWLDLNALQTQGGKVSLSSQPFWATIMALAIALYGISIILLGR